MMKTNKLSQRPSNGQDRTSGPNKENYGPQKRKGNPTKNGEIFGKWRKPKLNR